MDIACVGFWRRGFLVGLMGRDGELRVKRSGREDTMRMEVVLRR